jgi:hypothetical protein
MGSPPFKQSIDAGQKPVAASAASARARNRSINRTFVEGSRCDVSGIRCPHIRYVTRPPRDSWAAYMLRLARRQAWRGPGLRLVIAVRLSNRIIATERSHEMTDEDLIVDRFAQIGKSTVFQRARTGERIGGRRDKY